MADKNGSENIAETVGVTPMRWHGDALELLDQRLLPGQTRWLRYDNADAVAGAITDMVVRGAPAIGIAAAYGLALAARRGAKEFGRAAAHMAQARPTAVNLGWAVAQMRELAADLGEWDAAPFELLARKIQADDLAANRAMGRHASALIAGQPRIYTHCNTGALATSGWGTALGVVRQLHADQRLKHVYAGETRPWLQGARLTAWELAEEGIDHTLVVDSAAATLMAAGQVDCVLVGADRVTADGSVFNKIGTYSLAVLARHHGVQFIVVAPSTTLDLDCLDARTVQIEQRPGDEVYTVAGTRVSPAGTRAFNPVFDRTPFDLVDAIVTERGVFAPTIS